MDEYHTQARKAELEKKADVGRIRGIISEFTGFDAVKDSLAQEISKMMKGEV